MKAVVRCGSWDSGGSSRSWSFLRISGTFEGMAHALIVFEFFGAVENGILAKHRCICFEGEEFLPYTTDQFSISSKEILFGNHNSNVLVRSQMVEEVSRSDWSTRQCFDLGIDC